MFFFFIRKVECHLVPLHSREREREGRHLRNKTTALQVRGKNTHFFLVLGANWPFKKNVTAGAEANQPEVRP